MTKRYPRNRHGYSHRTSWGESEHGESPQNTSFNREHDCWTMGLMGFNVRWDFGWFWGYSIFRQSQTTSVKFSALCFCQEISETGLTQELIYEMLECDMKQVGLSLPAGVHCAPSWPQLSAISRLSWSNSARFHMVGMGMLWNTHCGNGDYYGLLIFSPDLPQRSQGHLEAPGPVLLGRSEHGHAPQ